MPQALTVVLVWDPHLVGPRFPREKLECLAKKRKKAGEGPATRGRDGKDGSSLGSEVSSGAGSQKRGVKLGWVSQGREPRARGGQSCPLSRFDILCYCVVLLS